MHFACAECGSGAALHMYGLPLCSLTCQSTIWDRWTPAGQRAIGDMQRGESHLYAKFLQVYPDVAEEMLDADGLISDSQLNQITESRFGVESPRGSTRDKLFFLYQKLQGVTEPPPGVRTIPYIQTTFKVEATLGSGAFGSVLQVKDRWTKQRYALKLMSDVAHPNNRRETDTLQWLRKEFGENKPHPNIVGYYDTFISSYRNLPYYVIKMEYLAGNDLDSLVRNKTSFTYEQIKHIGAGLYAGLNFLHSNFIVHRDIKLANVMIDDANQRAVIVDLGFACSTDAQKNESSVCDPKSPAGTALYMSPERAEKILASEAVPAEQLYSSDIWAAGLVMYTLLAGHTPWWFSLNIADRKLALISLYDLLSSHPLAWLNKMLYRLWNSGPSDRQPVTRLVIDSLSPLDKRPNAAQLEKSYAELA